MVFRSLRLWILLGSFLVLQVLILGGSVKVAQASDPVLAGVGSINQQISYQGKLMDTSGTIVPDGTYNMMFSVYSQATGGTPAWTAKGTTAVPTAIPVTVNDGLFTVMLGDTSAAGQWQNAFSSSTMWYSGTLYLGVTVGTDSEMTPRKAMGAVPQAFNALQLQGMSASGTALTRESLFSINRLDTSAISGPRSALDVKTQGTDPTNDFVARFMNSAGTTALVSIRGDGNLMGVTARFDSNASGPTMKAYNASTAATAWGVHVDKMLVSPNNVDPSAILGANVFSALVRYVGSSKNGVCLDDTETVGTCSFTAGASLVADGTINASAFDLAELYSISGEAEPGDLLVADSDHPLFVKRSTGLVYDEHLVGIVSTKPGFSLGDIASGTQVALAGRVPTKVSTMNGAIHIGDVLTSSAIPGMAMKATAPGRVVGYALEDASATGTIEVFVKVGYDAGSFLHTDASGGAVVQGNLALGATSLATPDATTMNSWGVTWRGSVWDGLQALKKEFTLFTEARTDGHSAFTLAMGTSTLWSVDEQGSMRVQGDLQLGGKFFPATRTGQQSDKYLFLDDTGSASTTYISTNADGWQANTSYDFAERYYSPDALEAGDVVALSQRGQFHVQRTLKQEDVPIGIVSTRPGFIAGAPATSTFPIALIGRVPTKVSALAGSIAIGDPLAVSSLPGVVVKAKQAGPIVGYAMEAYDSQTVGKIEVFVHAGWWGGSSANTNNQQASAQVSAVAPVATTTNAAAPKSYQGVARILMGATHVNVVYPSLGTFPLIQVTPYGKVDTEWWMDHSSDRGFDLYLKEPLGHDVTFSWRAEEMAPSDGQLFLSGGAVGQWNIYSGEPILAEKQPVTLPDATSAPSATSTTTSAPVISTTPTSTSSEVPSVATSSSPLVVDQPPATTSTESTGEPSTTPVVEPTVVPTEPSTESTSSVPVASASPSVTESSPVSEPPPVPASNTPVTEVAATSVTS